MYVNITQLVSEKLGFNTNLSQFKIRALNLVFLASKSSICCYYILTL